MPRCSEHLPISYCAIYTRQSIDTRSDFTSCQTQFEVCRNYLKSQQWLGWRWIEERFDDEGYSGATLDRPALQRLLEKVRRGEIDRVLVYSLDRLSRNVIDGLQLLQEFRQRGVALVVATYPELGSAAQDNLIINILSVFAEFERELIRNRIAKVRAALKRQGKRVGGAVPFGYDADPVTKQLVVNPEEGRRVRAMFEMAAEGLLPSGIAEAANQKGWRTKTREAKRTGKMSGGNPWTARQPPGCPSQEQRYPAVAQTPSSVLRRMVASFSRIPTAGSPASDSGSRLGRRYSPGVGHAGRRRAEATRRRNGETEKKSSEKDHAGRQLRPSNSRQYAPNPAILRCYPPVFLPVLLTNG